MRKRKLIVIHCTATKERQIVTFEDIKKWHLTPKPKGRGWKQVGYADMIRLDGFLQNLVEYNHDEIVDSWEITNGVAGINRDALHIVYVGGLDKNGKPKDTRTELQKQTMEAQLKYYLKWWPDVKIAGHYHFDKKACPCFDVAIFCRSIGISDNNIYKP